MSFVVALGRASSQGYERADRLTDLATISEGQPIDYAEIINHLKHNERVEDSGSRW